MWYHSPRQAAPAHASSSSGWSPHPRRQDPSPSIEPGSPSASPSPVTETLAVSLAVTGTDLPAPEGPSSASSSGTLPPGSADSSMPFPTSSSQDNSSLSSPTSWSANMSSTADTSATHTSSTSSKSKWTFTHSPSTTTSGHGAAATTFVPGTVFNMSMSMPSDAEAVYSVPMAFGHDPSGGDEDYRRAPSQPRQVLNMLVDLGSSDMWVASTSCKTAVCKDAKVLFDPELSDDSGVSQTINYHSGSVEGDIYWEQVTLGDFGIGYQAMIVGDDIENENLGRGNFSGLLGLALPANSVITKAIPGTTGSHADGATFLDNLFGAGASAPTHRFFSLSLQRADDQRTYSTFGIGEVFKPLCADVTKLSYVPIVANPRYGRTGYLHWRVKVDAIKHTSFGNEKDGSQPTTTSISLGRSATSANTTTPLAVLDSGGLAILVSNKTLLDSIYGAYNIQPGSDGIYRMPCTTQIALSLTIGGKDYPIHPLDVTWPEQDPSSSNCVGGLQYAPSIADTSDIVLGSAFLKNVYSVYQYPDQSKNPSQWQPTVGLRPLTDAAAASREFYAVRTLRQSLQVVSSGGGGGDSNGGGAAQEAAQHKAVNVAVIAASSVVGFLAIVAVAFCAWWFWLRRKAGTTGQTEYKMAAFDPETSTDTFRSRKHMETKRQRSMVDGYSDYEVESWRSGYTADSIGLTGVPEVHEEDDPKRQSAWDTGYLNHSRGQSLHQSLLSADTDSPQSTHTPLPDARHPEHRGSLAPELLDRRSRTSLRVDDSPRPRPTSLSLDRTLSMSGPFPSVAQSTTPSTMPHGQGRANEYDYFPVVNTQK